MYYSKKAARLIAIYSLAAVLVMGAFLVKAERRSAALERAAEVGYDHAFTELSTAVGELDAALKKSLCAASPSMVSTVCAAGYAHCAAASQAIASLPCGAIELEHTAAFLSRTGDYMFYLSRKAAGGEGLTQEEREALRAMSEGASQVSGALSEMTAQLLAGSISASQLERTEDAVADAEASLTGAGIVSGVKAMEDELPELPTLIYDGPFSQHLQRAQPRLLEGLAEVDEDGARRAAAAFFGGREEDWRYICYRAEPVPVYVFSSQYGNEVRTVEITACGGKVLYFGSARESAEGGVAPEEALRTAAAFLENHGYPSMTPTYHQAEGGELVASFAFEQDGVLCYPDLIKVTVALDTGEVVGMEAAGYVMCHAQRDLGDIAFDTEEKIAALSPYLTCLSHRPALIPTEGKNEVLCEEYTCKTPDGRHALVYLNAQTGREQQILLLLESESGTLTV